MLCKLSRKSTVCSARRFCSTVPRDAIGWCTVCRSGQVRHAWMRRSVSASCEPDVLVVGGEANFSLSNLLAALRSGVVKNERRPRSQRAGTFSFIKFWSPFTHDRRCQRLCGVMGWVRRWWHVALGSDCFPFTVVRFSQRLVKLADHPSLLPPPPPPLSLANDREALV